MTFLASAIALNLSMVAVSGAAVQDVYGPFNVAVLQGGVGVDREITSGAGTPTPSHPLLLSAWVKPDATQAGEVVILAIGKSAANDWAITLRGGVIGARFGTASIFLKQQALPNIWTHIATSYDGGTLRLFVDGKESGHIAVSAMTLGDKFSVAPVNPDAPHFGGSIVDAKLSNLTPNSSPFIRPNFALVQMWHVGVGWEWQNRANTGYWKQQDPWTLPHAKGPMSKPVATAPSNEMALQPNGSGRWLIHNWMLAAAPDVELGGAALSQPAVDTHKWLQATVPGTVLTTLVDRGIYPDPYYGLNNMAIPESLARQDYWYRTTIAVPPAARGKRLKLVFGGINYASEIWVNAQRLGVTKGAFVRGEFDFVPVEGENIVAVKVSPPPHPGIPHEQSIAGGVGENGGQLAIDGPTFVATEGWDWIPGIRDRNTGLWRPVELVATDAVRLGDPKIITDLPLPRIDSADIYVDVPVTNVSDQAVRTKITVRFDDVNVSRDVELSPRAAEIVRFTPRSDSALHIANPRLWWPNGYGDPTLHDMTIVATASGETSDTRKIRFGIREVSYDLSLFDSKGALRRVNVQPTDGRLAGQKLINVGHTAIKESPRGYAESLTAAGEQSPGVRDITESLPEPHLAILINGVRIAARGGSWGIDDALKRVSRDRLAPYFRLEREAHMNIIRNWMGNNDEDEFFDLADENGMMVLNDFWQSTQNFQVEPQDPALFIANARDIVARYRNHPSIVVWFGRNEGVPYPMLNEGLDDALFELDGTRWYTGSSNVVNLQGSGPYNYRPPVGYFTDLATGFSVETGTSSFSTLESIKASVPEADRWPLSDTFAYHDWHFSGNGDTKTFMAALEKMFGAGTSLEDFERKAQMMNIETHKAIYEGFLGHLWTKNSGRLLWMTHPGWPSNSWQIYSSDYDTHAAYYGAKKATEPLHVQLNLPDNELVVINTTQSDAQKLVATTQVRGLDNAELFTRTETVSARANQATMLKPVPLAAIFNQHPMVFVSLKLARSDGTILSSNFYWRGKDMASYQALNALGAASVSVDANAPVIDNGEYAMKVSLANRGAIAALNVKLTLEGSNGARILPAYYSDNYVSLLPGESTMVTIRYPITATITPKIAIRGWNVAPQLASRP